MLGYPGSDVAIPGETTYSPCGGHWRIYGTFLSARRIVELGLETHCESVLVRDPDEGPDAFELFVREELALSTQMYTVPGRYTCGRLHVNGTWDAATDTADDVLVAGKLCNCP